MTRSSTTSPANLPAAAADASTGLAIQATALVRRFGGVVAVDGLDLRVPRGGVYGLLGPNGAGKTTVIRILATLLRADAGTARILGHDLARDGDAVRRQISLTGQYASVDEDLTGRENLILLAQRGEAARERALKIYPAQTWRGPTQIRLHRAASLIAEGDVSEGAKYATRVLAPLSADRRSDRFVGAITERTLAVVPARAYERPAVADLRELAALRRQVVG